MAEGEISKLVTSYFWNVTPYGVSGRWQKVIKSIKVMMVMCEHSNYVLQITNLMRMTWNIWFGWFTRYSYCSKTMSFNSPTEKQTTFIIKMMNHLVFMVESCELWTLKPKLWASQIWTLIHLINNFVIVLVCSKCSKLITLEENIVSVQQHPLCLPLFFGFVSEVLNRGMKSCFDGVIFQDAVWEECFSIPLRCLHLQYFLTVFMRVLSLKLF